MTAAESQDGTSRLEGRCRRLLRAYPRPYRAERGEEILGTLLEAIPPDRAWPSASETRSVIVGGLKARAIGNRQLSLATNLRLAALLAASLWVSNSAAGFLAYPVGPGHFYLQHALVRALFALSALGSCLAIVSAWLWRRSITVTLALAVTAATVLAFSNVHSSGLPLGGWLVRSHLVALAVLTLLAIGKDRPPRNWLWMPAAYLIAPMPAFLLPGLSSPWYLLDLVVFVAILGVALLWFVVDARPLLAVGLYLEMIYGLPLFFLSLEPAAGQLVAAAGQLVAMVLIAAVLAAIALRARRGSAT